MYVEDIRFYFRQQLHCALKIKVNVNMRRGIKEKNKQCITINRRHYYTSIFILCRAAACADAHKCKAEQQEEKKFQEAKLRGVEKKTQRFLWEKFLFSSEIRFNFSTAAFAMAHGRAGVRSTSNIHYHYILRLPYPSCSSHASTATLYNNTYMAI